MTEPVLSDDLFNSQDASGQPLADRMRPRDVDEFAGQTHLLGDGKPLRIAIEKGRLHSMILWGPPGTGKTTLARLMARRVDAQFLSLSAVLSGVKEVRAAVEQAKQARAAHGKATVSSTSRSRMPFCRLWKTAR